MKQDARADGSPEDRALAFFRPNPYNGAHISPEWAQGE